MAEQTEPYANIVAGIEALAGDSLTTVELNRLNALINHRARVAYRLYDSWPEFWITKEQRQVRGDGGVESVFTDYVGTDLGENHVDTWMRFYQQEPFEDQSVFQFEHYEQGDKAYPVGYKNTYGGEISLDGSAASVALGLITVTTDTAHNVKVGDSIQLAGLVSGIQLESDTYDANNVMEVTSVASTTTLTAGTADADGSPSTWATTAATLETPQVWSSYAARLTVTYGDGAGQTATVPRRWADYLIRATYADFLRSDGQTEKAGIEEQIAQEVLDREIFMLDRQPNFLGAKTRIQTHTNRGARGTTG